MSRTDLWSPGCCPHLRFYGLKICHCAACHETFSGPRAFDAHQGDAGCRKPDEAGLVRRGELWKWPSRESLKPWWRRV
jgi:hypothetical protein